MTTICEVRPGEWAVVKMVDAPYPWAVAKCQCWEVISPIYSTSEEARNQQAVLLFGK